MENMKACMNPSPTLAPKQDMIVGFSTKERDQSRLLYEVATKCNIISENLNGENMVILPIDNPSHLLENKDINIALTQSILHALSIITDLIVE